MRPGGGLADALDAAVIEELLALAREAGGGGPIAVLDAEGTVLVGRLPGATPTAHAAHAAPPQPIEVDGRRLGSVVGGPDTAPALLALLARTLALAAGTAGESAARARLAEELEIGRRIQRSLIPRRFPEVPGWTFAAAYEAATEVGGDLYDAFTLRGRTDRLGLLVADVTGKGIPAALLMADVRALLHAAADNADGPADALGRVNRILARERASSLFVTACLLVVEATTGRVRFASAGHEPPLVARGREARVEELEAAGPVLGAFEDAVFEEREATLAPEDALVLYTDGITETRDAARRFFGEERLTATVAAACRDGAPAVAGAVMAAVRSFRGDADPFDDLTLLVAQRDPR